MIFIILAMLLYTAAILLGTTASRNLNTNLAAGITNIVSAIVPIVVAINLINKKTFQNHKYGIAMAV
jgi:hypothetical protein